MKKILKVLLILIAIIAIGLTILAVVSINSDDASEHPEPKSVEQIVYEDDNYKITFKGFDDNLGYCMLNLDVENKTDKSIDVFIVDASVNGTMVNVLSGTINTITGGCDSTRPYTLTSPSEVIESENIDTATFSVQIWDSETSETLLTTDPITVGD